MLSLLVSIWFQVLFHSPPGVLFTFPSRYYTLSVTKSYLALRDGPRIFPPDSSCPVVLWIPTTQMSMPPTRLSLSLAELSNSFDYQHLMICGSVTLLISLLKVWALPISLATTLGIVNLLSFPPVNEMFQFTGFPSTHYVFVWRYCISNAVSFLIRKSADQHLFAVPRRLSQLVTSFFGA